MTHQHNINNGIIRADGNVYIGDTIHYTIQQRFQDSHSVLFLRFEATDAGDYTARLSAKNAQSGIVDHYEQAVAVTIPPALFGEVEAFQAMRRNIGGQVRIGGAPTAVPIQAEAALTNLLQQTFFGGAIGAAIGQFMTLLQQGKLTELLLVISTDDDNLLQLPWEMVLPCLGTGADALPPNTFGLIRSHLATLDAFAPQGQTNRNAPLKVLFVLALPENMPEHAKQLQLENELRQLIEVAQNPISQPPLVIEILDCASLTEITDAITKRSHDIVHISGHGAYQADEQQGVLLLEDEDGNQQTVTGSQLGAAFGPLKSVKMLVISACETAAGEANGNVARQLAGVGLPAVLAMRFSVSDEAARQFARQFYGSLAAGDSLTKAVYDARQYLWQHTAKQRQANPQAAIAAEWFTPVLFQNQAIGPLIDQQQPYDAQTYRQFYPPLTFRPSQHTRLIGGDFIGRKRILIQLRKGFNHHQAMCLHGMGGLGKTTTAEAFANHYRTHHGNPPVLLFRKGSHAIEEVSILNRLVAVWKKRANPDADVVDDMEDIMKNPDVPTLEKLQAVIDTCLRACPMLLLFDNAEDVHNEQGHFHSADLRDFLRHLLRHLPKPSQILFTTRYAIADLHNDLTHLPLGQMTFAEQYRYIQASERLCRLSNAQQSLLYARFDGLPRAFEFLEGILTNGVAFDLAQLAGVESRLMENLLLGTLYNSLTDTERAVFAQASVLTGRVSVAALAYMLEQPEAALTPILRVLGQKALCFGYDDAVEIHTLTRAWLRQQGHFTPEAAKSLAHRAGQYYQAQPTWDDELLAKDYYEQAEAWDDYANAALNLAGQYQLTGFIDKATVFTDDVLAKPISSPQQAGGLNRRGLLCRLQGDNPKALICYEQSLSIFQQIGDKQGQGRTLNNISQIYQAQGDYATALTYLHQSLSIRQQIGDVAGMADTFHNMGALAYKQLKDYKQAIGYLMQSYQIFTRLGSPNVRHSESYLNAIKAEIGEEAFTGIIQAIQTE